MKQGAGELKASPQKFIAKFIDFTIASLSLYSAQSKGNYKKKKTKPKANTRNKMGRNKN